MAISAYNKYLLNKMNSIAQQVQLGTLLDEAGSVSASEITLAYGSILIGNSSGVAEAAAPTSAQILLGNSSSRATWTTVSGDVTITNAGVTAIAAGAIVNADVNASAAIDFSKLATLSSGNILVGSAGNVATSVAMTGDVTISNAGVTAIGANKVTVAMQHETVMLEATSTLTQANLLAISTPIQLIAAPGAGKLIIVDEIELFHDYATAVYADGSDVAFEYETTGDNIALVADSFFTGGVDQNAIIKPSTYALDGSTGTGVGFDVTANINKGVFVTATNFTSGDASNIVKWRIRYHVVTALT